MHYTPHYDWMVGIETDVNHIQKNEDRGFKIGNSGGTVTNVALVADWRMINAFGGNFKLRGSVGLPVYEDLNSSIARNARGEFTQAQLGGGFFANLAIQWTYRKASFDYIY